MCASQQVGDSPSSSQQTKKSAISVNREGGDSVRMCLFAKGAQNEHPTSQATRNASTTGHVSEGAKTNAKRVNNNNKRGIKENPSDHVENYARQILQMGLFLMHLDEREGDGNRMIQ
ncbi:hypothetical protein ACROYT_G004674 [Oculina patagonica]